MSRQRGPAAVPTYETGYVATEASRDYFARFQTSLYGLPTPVWV